MPDNLQKLQWIYDQELHANLGWIWDGGIAWELGWPAELASGEAATVEQAVDDMYHAAVKHIGEDFKKEGC